jgi:hypothetical protein
MLLGLLRRFLPVHDISTDYDDPPHFLQGKQTRLQLVSMLLLLLLLLLIVFPVRTAPVRTAPAWACHGIGACLLQLLCHAAVAAACRATAFRLVQLNVLPFISAVLLGSSSSQTQFETLYGELKACNQE